MVLLTKISENAIVENLKKRLFDDQIYVSFYAITDAAGSSLLCYFRLYMVMIVDV